ncbi:hypothetical protein HK405_009929 [Cladochytrium tenue]|nr:hypothetical protein HK405_009929 [Cladochytrium tenue]
MTDHSTSAMAAQAGAAATPKEHKPREFVLREATEADAEDLAELARRTFCDTFAHLYSPKDLDTFLDSAYTPAQMRTELRDPARTTLLLFERAEEAAQGGKEERAVGFGTIGDRSVKTGDAGPADDYVEIKRVYTDRALHGSGAGRVLMDALMARALALPRRVVWLGVWEHNVRAQRFYKRYGFVEAGEHTFMVGSVADRDLLFELRRPLPVEVVA